MKNLLDYIHSLFFLFTLLVIGKSSSAQSTPGIVLDWAEYIGYQDTVLRVPILEDIYGDMVTAGFTVDDSANGGANILVVKYKGNGDTVWARTYTSSGNNRDQATCIAIDDSGNIFIGGFIHTATTDYDFIVLKYDSAGALIWSEDYNGTSNGYDIPSAIDVYEDFVYVTGASNNTGTLVDFATIQLDKYTGTQNWVLTFDSANLFDVPLDISPTYYGVVVTGACQKTISAWNYTVISYYDYGAPRDTIFDEGTGNGFDRANAIKNDGFGNFYITGASADSDGVFNIKTIKINSGDTIEWIIEYNGENNLDDEGNGITPDDSGNVYVCGKTKNGNGDFDYILIKYDQDGSLVWKQIYDGTGEDIANAVCIDSYGKIVVTGQSVAGKYDFYTIAYDSSGEEAWHHRFNGVNQDDDFAMAITADDNGNIYVTGQSGDGHGGFEQVTIKYRTSYFIFPEDTQAAPSSLLFYQNSGQILKTDTTPADDVYNYTINQHPKIYFHRDSVSFAMASIDNDTAAVDTLERISMNFVDGNISESPYQSMVHDTDQILNYFLGHCPEGITGVQGAEKLTYENVYSNIDVIFANNNAGMKMQIFVGPKTEPEIVQLNFTGQESLAIINQSDLQINGILGSFTYERPLIYQIDGEGNRISLGWLASYYLIDSATVGFTFGGGWDWDLPLVIELAKEENNISSAIQGNLNWSTWYGDIATEHFMDAVTDHDHNKIVVGSQFGGNFPLVPGATPFQGINAGGIDAVMVKFNFLGQRLSATYVGGTSHDSGEAVAVDSEDNVYIIGYTSSPDFPNQDFNTGSSSDYFQNQVSGYQDGFIFELADNVSTHIQTKIWGTYFGGSHLDFFEKAKIDPSDNLFIVGTTTADDELNTDFPVPTSQPSGAYFQSCAQYADLSCTTMSGFMSVTTSSTASLEEGSVVIGPGISPGTLIASIFSGTVFILNTAATLTGTNTLSFSNGTDGTIIKFNDDHELIWSTCYGGAAVDGITNLDIDQSGNVYSIGLTRSANFPTYDPNPGNDYFDGSLGGDADAFMLKFNNSGIRQYATYYGGNGDERGYTGYWFGLPTFDWGIVGGAITVTASGNIFLTGTTTSTNNAMLQNAGNAYYQSTNGGFSDVWIARFNSNLQRVWGTYYGSNGSEYGNDMCVDNSGILYICGSAYSLTAMPFPSPPTNTYSHAFIDFFDCFITTFTPWGTNIWGTYFGGSGSPNDIGDLGVCMTYDHAPYLNQVVVYGISECSDYVYEDPGFGTYVQPSLLGAHDAVLTRFSTDILHAISIDVDEIIGPLSALSVFPNPANQQCYISFESNSKSPLDLVLYNFLGEEVQLINLGKITGKVQYQLDLSSLPNGIYNVQVISKEQLFISKIIKY